MTAHSQLRFTSMSFWPPTEPFACLALLLQFSTFWIRVIYGGKLEEHRNRERQWVKEEPDHLPQRLWDETELTNHQRTPFPNTMIGSGWTCDQSEISKRQSLAFRENSWERHTPSTGNVLSLYFLNYPRGSVIWIIMVIAAQWFCWNEGNQGKTVLKKEK